MAVLPRAPGPSLIGAALFAACIGSATAAELAIVNPGFEAEATPPGAFLVGVPLGWSLYDPGGIVDQNRDAVGRIRPLPGLEYFPGGTPEGDQAALVFLDGPVDHEAGLEQVLAATLQPLTRYTLSVGIGNIASGTSLPGSSDGGGVFYDLSGFPGYRIELRAGDTLLAASSGNVAPPEGGFETDHLSFATGVAHAALGQALAIRLVNLDGLGIEVDFDDVRLSAVPVPEPTTTALWLAAGGLAWLRSRRQARRATGGDDSGR